MPRTLLSERLRLAPETIDTKEARFWNLYGDARVVKSGVGPLVLAVDADELDKCAMTALKEAWPYWPFPDIHDSHIKRLMETMRDAIFSLLDVRKASAVGRFTLLPGKDDSVAVLMPPGVPHKAGTAPIIRENTLVAILEDSDDQG